MHENTADAGLANFAGDPTANDVRSAIATLLPRLLPTAAEVMDVNRTFLEMGATSLTFMEISLAVEKHYGIHIPIGRFFQDLTSPAALEHHIESESNSLPETQLPAQNDAVSTVPAVSTEPLEPVAAPSVLAKQFVTSPAPSRIQPTTELESIFSQQLQAMSDSVEQVVAQQLEFLRSTNQQHMTTSAVSFESLDAPRTVPSSPQRSTPAPTPTSISTPTSTSTPTPTPTPTPATPVAADAGNTYHSRPVTAKQQQFLDNFFSEYNARTQKSKSLVQSQQRMLADTRLIMGFSPEIKEVFYPIFADQSEGAHIRDVDRNDYVDLAMGAGVYLFGHNPEFISDAIQAQLADGIQLGPQSPLSGEVAELICEITDMERVAFCCSGTEAVMTALRLARAARNRSKIVMFAGSYHGHSDGTLFIPRPGANALSSVPMVPGIPDEIANNVIVLDYGSPQSLAAIMEISDELAGVLVEPVQSRRPDFQPREFLLQLRKLTQEQSIPLIFDEMITGFRLHPKGAQGMFGVQADLATYGKVIGGGMPFGIVAGKREFLDWIDGGSWNYQDASLPQNRTTYSGGTFRKHPLALAAAKVVLSRLKTEGNALQERLNQRTSKLAADINTYFAEKKIPIKMAHCGSMFRFVMDNNYSYMYQPLAMDLFYYHMIASGIYFWEGRTCFLTTAHTEADLARVDAAVKSTCEVLQANEFLPRPAEKVMLRTVTNDASGVGGDGEEVKLPLKDDQRHLRLLHQMDEEGSLAYQNFLSYRLRGDVDIQLLRQCVEQVFDRHDALRTVICQEEDAQIVLPELPIDITLDDFSDQAPAEREQSLREWFSRESHKPMDIYQGPLARVSLVKMEEDQYILTLTAHHIVIDGWSMSLIITEICQLYIAAKQGQPALLESPYQFSDYLRRYAERMQTKEMAAHEAYWLEQFQNSIPVLNLPTDYPTPNLRKFRGGRRTSRIDRQLVDEIQQLATDHSCTLFITLMSVYFILLHRLTGQSEIVVGVPSGGRFFEGGGRLVGYCTSMMAIRHQLKARLAFTDYLDDFKQVALEAFSHQEYPFARLNDKLLMRSGSKHSSIVSVTFNMEPVLPQPELPGIEAELLSHPIGYAGVDLLLNCTENYGDLILDLDYNSGLFAPETADRLLDQFHTLLEAIATDPDLTVADLPLLNAAERHRLLVEWNLTDRVIVPTDCLHQLFEQQVAARPEAVAVEFEGHHLTYEQLNARANQLAHYLERHGVVPEVMVGIAVERSLELVVGILGIVKAGGAYVPLDAEYPKSRLEFMMQDTKAPVLLTQSSLLARLPETAARIVCLDTEWEAISKESEANPGVEVSARNLAYVMYTSGSTGRPKGTCIEQRSVVRLVKETNYIEFGTEEVFLQYAPISFDAATFELWGSLLNGSKLVVCPPGLLSLDELARVIREGGVTTLWLTAALFRRMVEAQAQTLQGVRQLLAGGEALSVAPVRRMLSTLAQGARLVNGYGPTENTTFTCCHVMTRESEVENTVPIGRPISNTTVYVLDGSMQPVPVGVPGELYIGGVGLARGYLNQPALTAEKFVPDPFDGSGGGRLYRTGDRVRYRADGVIEFLGRLDHQVKIRGFRIELGEIEAVLSRHPAVRESVVVAHPTPAGDQRLVLYVVPHGEPDDALRETMRAFLKERLPAYMVPTALVVMKALPLTANGKIDREALPVEEVSEGNYEAPRTPIEEILAAIFADVLAVDRVGIVDDFFELGGHSLLAAMAVTRIRETFNNRLEPRRMFESPTVAGLAAYIEAELKVQQAPARPPIPVVDHHNDLPLSFAQERMWFIDQLWADITTYNLLYGMRVKGPLNVDALQQSLTEIVRRHEILRTIYPATPGSPCQRILPELSLELPVIDLRNLPAAEQAAKIEDGVQQEALKPFDLNLECPLRARLLQVGSDNHVVLLTFHHIAFDGWSEGVLNRELAALYDAFTKGLPSPLAPLPVQYADFALWQRNCLTDEVLRDQIGYWQEELRDSPGLLQLPFTRQPPAHKTFRGAAEDFKIDATLAHGLRRLGRRSGTTLYTTLLGTYVSLLSGYSSQTTMVINTPVVTRQPLELESLIGFFVSTMMVRADLSGNPTFLELLARLHRKALAGYGFDDVPFAQLLGGTALPAKLERTPLLHLMFNLANAPTGHLEVGGLTITPLEAEGIIARPTFTLYDLALSLRDTQQGLYGELRYNADLFNAELIKNMLENFEKLLRAVVADPHQRLSEFESAIKIRSVELSEVADVSP